ncbi:MAG: hypothetical protein RBT63_01135 [Bdellovibrionales bacterium]|nr:hypothetical protein [Bdellovibrionales bacterium]
MPSPKITVRRTTALPQKRSEIEAFLTHEGVEKFLNELGRGAIETQIVAADASKGSTEGEELSSESFGALALGDTVTVRLTNLEFSGLTGLAQMLLAAKAPDAMKSAVEKTSVFGKVGAGLDTVYGLLRSGLTFSSKITEWDSKPEALVYVDEGVQLPKPLKSWKHTHRITETEAGGMIIDELEVEVEPAIAAPLVEGLLRLHLESRAAAYRKAIEAMGGFEEVSQEEPTPAQA